MKFILKHGETIVESYYIPINVEFNQELLCGVEADIGGDEVDVSGGDEADVGGGDEADVGGESDVGDEQVNLVDDEHSIKQVDVPMIGFWFNLDSNDEGERETVADPLRPKLHINEDNLEVIDYNSYKIFN